MVLWLMLIVYNVQYIYVCMHLSADAWLTLVDSCNLGGFDRLLSRAQRVA